MVVIDCFNENYSGYNYPIYKYIRNNELNWNDIRKVVIGEVYLHSDDQKEQLKELHDFEETFRRIKKPLCNAQAALQTRRDREKYRAITNTI